MSLLPAWDPDNRSDFRTAWIPLDYFFWKAGRELQV